MKAFSVSLLMLASTIAAKSSLAVAFTYQPHMHLHLSRKQAMVSVLHYKDSAAMDAGEGLTTSPSALQDYQDDTTVVSQLQPSSDNFHEEVQDYVEKKLLPLSGKMDHAINLMLDNPTAFPLLVRVAFIRKVKHSMGVNKKCRNLVKKSSKKIEQLKSSSPNEKLLTEYGIKLQQNMRKAKVAVLKNAPKKAVRGVVGAVKDKMPFQRSKDRKLVRDELIELVRETDDLVLDIARDIKQGLGLFHKLGFEQEDLNEVADAIFEHSKKHRMKW